MGWRQAERRGASCDRERQEAHFPSQPELTPKRKSDMVPQREREKVRGSPGQTASCPSNQSCWGGREGDAKNLLLPTGPLLPPTLAPSLPGVPPPIWF